jgi:hypothetical protein
VSRVGRGRSARDGLGRWTVNPGATSKPAVTAGEVFTSGVINYRRCGVAAEGTKVPRSSVSETLTSAALAGNVGAGMTLLDALQPTQTRPADACSDGGSALGVLEAEDRTDAGHVEHPHDLTRNVA